MLVDPELLEIFQGYYARAKGEFVIESDCEPDPAAPYDHYRCHRDMDLIAWLREHGVVSRTPLHTVRKEYGSQIHARYGLTAAQEMLRHADVAVTAAHYVENKQRSFSASDIFQSANGLLFRQTNQAARSAPQESHRSACHIKVYSRVDQQNNLVVWYEKVGDGPDTYILVTQERLPEEEWTKLFEQHAEHQKRVPAGWALLIDLRSKEPIIKPVPKDHKPQ